MAQTKQIGLIGAGILALGIGGYFVYKYATKKNITVQYMADEDANAARAIQKAINASSLKQGYLNPWQLDGPTVFVGGRMANASVSQLEQIGAIDSLPQDNNGHIFVGTNPGGFQIWVVEGWTQAGTLASANYIQQNGLPTSHVQIPIATTQMSTYRDTGGWYNWKDIQEYEPTNFKMR